MTFEEIKQKAAVPTVIGLLISNALTGFGNWMQHKERMLEIQLRHDAEMRAEEKAKVIEEQRAVMNSLEFE